MNYKTHPRLYQCRYNMKTRCNNPKYKDYNLYWWRWIKVVKEWLDWNFFATDMGQAYEHHCKEYWEKNTTLERIDNDLWYSPSNCMRTTKEAQSKNRSTNIIYKWVCLKDYCRENWLKYNTVYMRIKRGKSIEEAILF